MNANGTQGTAPFPYRHLRKDESGTHLSSTEASLIVQALLNQFLNGGLKITVVLHSLRDRFNHDVPLWQIKPDTNILMPELLQGLQALQGRTALPTAPTTNINLFYIDEATYDENNGQTPQLTLSCVTFRDLAYFQIARMQYHHVHQARATKLPHNTRAAGSREIGQSGMTFNNAVAGSQVAVTVNFQTQMSAAPSSVTLTPIHNVNTSAITVTDITNAGFTVQWTPTANGTSTYIFSYQPVGN